MQTNNSLPWRTVGYPKSCVLLRNSSLTNSIALVFFLLKLINMQDDNKPLDAAETGANADGDEGISEKLEGLTSLATELLDEVKALLPPSTVNVRGGIDFYREVERFEIELIQRALDKTGWHQTRAASLLKIKITTLNSKIKRYNIAPGSITT